MSRARRSRSGADSAPEAAAKRGRRGGVRPDGRTGYHAIDAPPTGAPWAEMLTAIRRALDCSQEDLARKLGASWTSVNHWEKGRHKPHPRIQAAIKSLMAEVSASAPVPGSTENPTENRPPGRPRTRPVGATAFTVRLSPEVGDAMRVYASTKRLMASDILVALADEWFRRPEIQRVAQFLKLHGARRPA